MYTNIFVYWSNVSKTVGKQNVILGKYIYSISCDENVLSGITRVDNSIWLTNDLSPLENKSSAFDFKVQIIPEVRSNIPLARIIHKSIKRSIAIVIANSTNSEKSNPS